MITTPELPEVNDTDFSMFDSVPLPRPKREPYPWQPGEPLDFFMAFNPPKKTAQQKGSRAVGDKVVHYTKTEHREIEAMLREQMAPFAPAAPMEGPLSLTMEWFFPWRASESARNRHRGQKWHTAKPDCSNIVKLPEDVLSAKIRKNALPGLGFYRDDSEISELIVRKRWADTPGIRIVISQLSEL